MNVWDIVILLAVVFLAGRGIFKMRKDRKSGKCSCGGECDKCGGCPSGTGSQKTR